MNPAEDNEPFVTPEEAAHFLKISPVTVKKMAREGWLPAHPIGNGVRKRWRFRISELVSHMRCRVESEASSGRSKASEGSQNPQGFSFMYACRPRRQIRNLCHAYDLEAALGQPSANLSRA